MKRLTLCLILAMLPFAAAQGENASPWTLPPVYQVTEVPWTLPPLSHATATPAPWTLPPVYQVTEAPWTLPPLSHATATPAPAPTGWLSLSVTPIKRSDAATPETADVPFVTDYLYGFPQFCVGRTGADGRLYYQLTPGSAGMSVEQVEYFVKALTQDYDFVLADVGIADNEYYRVQEYSLVYTGKKAATPLSSDDDWESDWQNGNAACHLQLEHWSAKGTDTILVSMRMSPELVYAGHQDPPQPTRQSGGSGGGSETPESNANWEYRPVTPCNNIRCDDGKVPCTACDGRGDRNCVKCHGSGTVPCSWCGGDGWLND